VANGRHVDEELAAFLGWPGTRPAEFEWTDVEAELGYQLPADFKALMSQFPSGAFVERFYVPSPVQGREWLDRFQETGEILLNDLFDRRESAEEEGENPAEIVPYPIHPEPGGLIPWGSGDEHGYYWLATDLAKPDDWTVVYGLTHDVGWGKYDGTMSQFLYEVITGTYTDPMLYFRPKEEERKFVSWS
jgi:hypothetical protein